MSNHGDAPESSVTTVAKEDDTKPEDVSTQSPKPAQNGVPKADLDEFGLPIRKKKRISFQEPEVEDGAKMGGKADEAIKEEDTEALKETSGGAVKEPLPVDRIPIPLEGTSKEPEAPAGAPAAPIAGEEEEKEAPVILRDKADEPLEEPTTPKRETNGVNGRKGSLAPTSPTAQAPAVSEASHQRMISEPKNEPIPDDEGDWQTMPAYAPFDIYDDNNKLIAREAQESDDEANTYSGLGGAGKGYTRVTVDDDAQSATSMDDQTAYLFKEQTTGVVDEDEDSRDVLAQMSATKDLLTDTQRIAYVGITRLAMMQMQEDMEKTQRTRAAKKMQDHATENLKMWAQKMVLRLYMHMDIESAEQLMIEQLSAHGVTPADLSPTLMKNARVKNPLAEEANRFSISSSRPSTSEANRPSTSDSKTGKEKTEATLPHTLPTTPDPPPKYPEKPESPPPYDSVAQQRPESEVLSPTDLPKTEKIDIDIRWTVLCDLFLVLIADSVYDSRSRQLLENVGKSLEVPWLDICRFEKRVTDALEIQEAAENENWNEDEHMEARRKHQRNRRLAMMGLATVGGALVIGLSAGALAPLIGAGLAAGFTTIGVAGTSGFLTGAGGIAAVAATGVVSGGAIGQKAAKKRTGAVKTFEYRPLHNNKRTNLIVTISGWMTGKVDDVRLPFSTVDPIMGDIYSIYWEPEMLRSMGDTIGILASEALTQTLQQVLGSTILISLMAAIQLPIVLTKLSYLIDNPWSNSLARAHLAGLILADSLIDRNLGTRPITLVGFSLGAKVIMSCLSELASKGAYGLIQNVYLFGSPVIANKDAYLKAKTVVAGRFVNGYATNDWILGYLFRATGGGVMRVAGLAPVEVAGIENVNVSEFVPGHMQYRAAMPKILRHVGWEVESDEFAEIEDPDPDNHEKRQRELINEIEEARKDLEKKSDRKFFGMFKRNKKKGEKKEWETYDERSKELPHENKPEEGDADGAVMFDVDIIRSQVARMAAQQELEAEGIEVRELESTMPPMRLDSSASSSMIGSPALKSSKSYNGSVNPMLQVNGDGVGLERHSTNPSSRPSYDNWDDYDKQHVSPPAAAHDDNISLTFDTTYREPPSRTSFDPPSRSSFDPDSSRPSFEPPVLPSKEERLRAKSVSPVPSWTEQPQPPAPAEDRWRRKSPSPRPPTVEERPPLSANHSASGAAQPSYEHNAWADEDADDYGKEKEVTMTFA